MVKGCLSPEHGVLFQKALEANMAASFEELKNVPAGTLLNWNGETAKTEFTLTAKQPSRIGAVRIWT